MMTVTTDGNGINNTATTDLFKIVYRNGISIFVGCCGGMTSSTATVEVFEDESTFLARVDELGFVVDEPA